MIDKYEVKCEKCDGDGYLDRKIKSYPWKRCNACRGRGSFLNDEGKDLICFIEFHLESGELSHLIPKGLEW